MLPTFANQRVTVMGLGRFEGGVGVTRWLVEQGARVTVSDRAPPEKLAPALEALAGLPVTLRLGEHREADFRDADLIVVNPAVPPTSEYLRIATTAGVPITTEINLFVQRCSALTIGITGSVGKSTVTAMIGHMLTQALAPHAPAPHARPPNGPRRRVWVGGNIGRSLLAALPEISADDIVVLELSSFQLHRTPLVAWSPHVAVITNVTPNHLDWHGSFAAYLADKLNIVRFQKPERDHIIIQDTPALRETFERLHGDLSGLWRYGLTDHPDDSGCHASGCHASGWQASGWHASGWHALARRQEPPPLLETPPAGPEHAARSGCHASGWHALARRQEPPPLPKTPPAGPEHAARQADYPRPAPAPVPTAVRQSTAATDCDDQRLTWPTLHLDVPGRHNRENAAAALTVAHCLGIAPADACAALATFQALPHRLQRVAERAGVTYYDDSKSTTPEAALTALAAFDQPLLLILGGYDKGSDLGPLAAAAAQRAKFIACIGKTGPALADAIHAAGGHVQLCPALPEAVAACQSRAAPGDVILLSPACASWDQFADYRQRGEQFAHLARAEQLVPR